MENKTSMLYWHPRIKDLPIPQPYTEFVLEKNNWLRYLEEPLPEADISVLKHAAASIGYPLFMRTDLASGKHDYLHTCYVEGEKNLLSNIANLIDDNAMHDQWFSTIVLREYLNLDWRFKAFGGLPIAPERRYFVKGSRVMCRHPYWPPDAIRFWRGAKEWEGSCWKQWLEEMNYESGTEVTVLTGYATIISNTLEGEWSIDFARDRDGKWWLLDMAEANRSWHPKHKEEEK